LLTQATSVCPTCGRERPKAGWPIDQLLFETIGGRFKVEGLIGQGGFGAVYEASHLALGGRRAVKVLRYDMAQDEALVERFRREAQTLYRLNAPQLVKVEDFGCLTDGRPFIVMELVDGVPLDRAIRRDGPMSALRTVRITREVLLALAEAHDAAVLHRDLKAENVMICRDAGPGSGERVKVLDLGVQLILGDRQRLTRASRAIGTPEYMSPEQWQGLDDIDERTDLFALGVLMYEMLTGRVPFPREDGGPSGIYKALMQSMPRPISAERADLPDGLESLVFRLMSKERELRPVSAMITLTQLERIRAAMGKAG